MHVQGLQDTNAGDIGNSLIESIFAKHGAEIAADTLADSIKLGSAGYVKDWEINGESVTLGVEKS